MTKTTPKKNPNYYIWSLGCAMNKADAERIATVLDNHNYTEAKDEKTAELIIVVACSIRQAGIDRILGKAKQWDKKITVLTGCVLEQDKPKMEKIFDLIFNIKDLKKLPLMLKKIKTH